MGLSFRADNRYDFTVHIQL